MIKALKATREWPEFNSGEILISDQGPIKASLSGPARAPVKLSNLIGNYFDIFSPRKHLSLSAELYQTPKPKSEKNLKKLTCVHLGGSSNAFQSIERQLVIVSLRSDTGCFFR